MHERLPGGHLATDLIRYVDVGGSHRPESLALYWQRMSPSLSELLKLPAGERAELAMALWESLSDAEREGELELTPDEASELDRRWMDHVQRPESSIPWDEVRRKLLDRE